jgi:hypothetical protein
MNRRPIPAARYFHLLHPEESQHQSTPASSAQLTGRISRSHLTGFFTGTFSSFTILLLIWPLLTRHNATTDCVTSYSHSTTFTPHPEYANLSHIYDELWDAILPANGGFLIDSTGSSGITMFHQLHCLQLLRVGLQRAHDVGGGHEDMMVPVVDMHEHDVHANPEHYLHCLDYLRQVRAISL